MPSPGTPACKNPANLVDQVSATIPANAASPADVLSPAAAATQVPINLYTVQQVDGGGAIANAISTGGTTSDFKQIYDALNAGGRHVLLEGDANFNGRVDSNDYATTVTNFGQRGAKWSSGDYNFNGRVDSNDYAAAVTNFGQRADAATGSTVSPSVASSGAVTLTSPAANAAATPNDDRVIVDVDPNTGHVYLLANNAKLVSYEVSGNSANFLANGRWQKLNLGVVLADSSSDLAEGIPQGTPFVLENGPIDLGQLVAPGLPTATYLAELGSPGFTAYSVIDTTGSLFSTDSNGSPGLVVVAPVPEPASLAATGLAAVALLGRRRRRRAGRRRPDERHRD